MTRLAQLRRPTEQRTKSSQRATRA